MQIEVISLKNNILKNISLGQHENVLQDFRKLDAIGTNAQILMTDKRIIIYTKGSEGPKGNKVNRKRMNEIKLESIHRYEYYEESKGFKWYIKLIGFVVFALALGLLYATNQGLVTIPAYPYQSVYTDYAISGVLAVVGMYMIFAFKKWLKMDIWVLQEKPTSLKLRVTKYNELALRYIAGKLHLR